MLDAVGVRARHVEGVIARPVQVSGIEEEVHRLGVGVGHQAVHLGPRLHAGAHVVVVAQPHALLGRHPTEEVEALLPCVPTARLRIPACW